MRERGEGSVFYFKYKKKQKSQHRKKDGIFN